MMRTVVQVAALVTLIAGTATFSRSQTNSELNTYFQQYLGLGPDQIAAIRGGQGFAKNLKSRIPDEIFMFGAIYVHAAPESYVKYSEDFERLRKLPEYLALGKFSNPPVASDLKGFSFDSKDIEALKNCKPNNCQVQLPASGIEALQKSVDLSAPDAGERVDQFLHARVVERLLDYQQGGNQILGMYNDKKNPTQVAEQFKYMLSYYKALPKLLPEFNRYLLAYPEAKLANVEDSFYWAKVNFGLKPTLRVVHVVTMHGNDSHEPAYVIAGKQLYSSHYFETALDLAFCVRDTEEPKQSGFYLIMVMGSEQSGLTGMKGSLVRNIAVGRSVKSLQNSLVAIKNALEHPQ
jgi:hypothetical protein